MSESKIQVSFKLPNGTIPLFRGDTIDEVEKLMQDAALSTTFVGSMEASFARGSSPSSQTIGVLFERVRGRETIGACRVGAELE